MKDIVERKLAEAKTLIDEARGIAERNNIYFTPIGNLFTQGQITDELGDGWDSSDCW